MRVEVRDYPDLDLQTFRTDFVQPLGELVTPGKVLALFDLDGSHGPGILNPPITRTEEVRQEVRNLLRHGGHKPTGRGKPASEYLVQAAGRGELGSINLAVDILNVVSLHSGIPISVVDTARATPPYRVKVPPDDAAYIFNTSGQSISLKGLLSLFDAEGPCANAVRDSQRTKTSSETTTTLSILWGTAKIPGLAEKAAQWYRALLEEFGASTVPVEMVEL